MSARPNVCISTMPAPEVTRAERKTMLQVNDKIQIHLFNHPGGREIITRNYGKFFTVTQHPQTGRLCVEWGSVPYGDSPLLPLSSFAPTTVFVNIVTGKRFHWSTITDSLEPL